ncbi:MAG: hypothetical protein ACOX85_03190 [Candidatus Pararuminococcus gallinarum]
MAFSKGSFPYLSAFSAKNRNVFGTHILPLPAADVDFYYKIGGLYFQ